MLRSLVLLAIVTGVSQGSSAPAKAPKGCRVYPSSIVQTSISPGTRIVQTTRGRFDPATLEMRLDVRYESTPGTGVNYRKTIRYASIEDFVNETELANPPLNLWLEAQLSGGVIMTVTNTFDTRHRLVRTVTRQPTGTDTTTHTAWDTLGRPTASRTERDYSLVSTFAFAYDDSRRTMTQTVKTDPLTSIVVTEFDVNGYGIKGTSRIGPSSSSMAYQNGDFVTQCVKSPLH